MAKRAARPLVSVLEPVVRRRRRRLSRRLPVLFGIPLAVAGAALFVLFHRGAASSGSNAARTQPVRIHRAPTRSLARHSLPQLVVGPPLAERPLWPRVTARAAILVDAGTGRVIWQRWPHRRLPIASTTKIMTALLALQRLRPSQVVRVNPTVTRVPLVREGLRAHERVQVWKLLDGLLIYSGNDDALALAIASAGSRRAFVAEMDEEARSLGLRDTHFSGPSGVIDAGNRSSAWDLAALARYALRNDRFRAIVRRRIARVRWSPPTFEKTYVNKNALLGTYPGADGIKTGWTTLAGHCLVASATRNGRTLIAVLLHDENDYADARRLFDFGFRTTARPLLRPHRRPVRANRAGR